MLGVESPLAVTLECNRERRVIDCMGTFEGGGIDPCLVYVPLEVSCELMIVVLLSCIGIHMEDSD